MEKEKNWRHGLQLAIVKEVLLPLETAQEDSVFTQNESSLPKRLKVCSLGLALIENSRIWQRSRLTNIG